MAERLSNHAADARTQPARQVWVVLAAIPAGRVATYGQVAELAGLPRGARLVGRLLAQLPVATQLPWHRVVTASGRIALRAGGGARVQRDRLLAEGVTVRDGRVDLARVRWQP
jgi:methylated-DNA-protein-cysteine methyltransferase-like protein